MSKGRMGTSVAVVDIDPKELESMEKQLEKVRKLDLLNMFFQMRLRLFAQSLLN